MHLIVLYLCPEMSKVNRNCFLSVDSCLLDLSVGSIFKIDKLSRISWKSIHSVLASRIHLFGGVEKKRKKPLHFFCCTVIGVALRTLPWMVRHKCSGNLVAMWCVRWNSVCAFEDSGMNIQPAISAGKVWTELGEKKIEKSVLYKYYF